MDEISELEKYKELLDSGAISEKEFSQLKQKLLGLKTDEEKEAERQAERTEALKEIDAMREAQQKKEEAKKQEEAERHNQAEEAITKSVQEEQAEPEQQKQTRPEFVQEAGEDTEPVQQEKVNAEPEQPGQEAQQSAPVEENAKAQPTAEQKHEDAPKTEQPQKAQSSAGSVVKSVILWIVCILLIFLGIPSLTFQNTFYVLFGIVLLILAVLACPLITSKTKDVPALATFYQIKVPVVVVLAILAFVFMMLA